MIDLDYLRDHVPEIKKNCQNRQVTLDIDHFISLDQERSNLIKQVEAVRAERNVMADRMPKISADQKKELSAQAKELKKQLQGQEEKLLNLEKEWKQLWLNIPNLTHPKVPIGGEAAAKTLRTWGTPPTFSFTPKTHVELGEQLDLIDFTAGAKVSGQKFYYLKNEAAVLEMALTRFAVDEAMKHGFELMLTPDLARPDILEGIGYNPRGKETQVYSIQDHDLALIGSAEITIGGYHAQSTFTPDQLPKKYVGVSHCFRTEAGAYGKESTGLYRVHQFTKVELFVFCLPGQAEQIHEEILALEEQIFQALEVPYRVIDCASGDLGAPAYRKFDIEAWMPFKNDYGEVTSASNVTDYQARRLHIKYQVGKKMAFVHMLNGTALAMSRAPIAILENHQTKEGTVRIPKALQPYMNGLTEIK